VELEPGETANYGALAWQLYITDDCTFHLRQRLLHPLDVPAGTLYQIIPLPPVGPHHANLR